MKRAPGAEPSASDHTVWRRNAVTGAARAITYGFNSETESIRLVVETIDATRRD